MSYYPTLIESTMFVGSVLALTILTMKSKIRDEEIRIDRTIDRYRDWWKSKEENRW